MTVDSSTTTITRSGEGSINSSSRRRSLPSPWAQVVRGGGESESVVPRSPKASEQHFLVSHQLAVIEPALVVVAQPDGSDGSNSGNAGGGKKSAWNKPSANGVVEGSNSPVMDTAWPALSESTRPVPKSLSSSEQSPIPSFDGLVNVFQAPETSQTRQKPVKTNANNHSNTTNNYPIRQQSMRRGGSAGSTSSGANRPPPPPPPPLPPPFPFFDMTHISFVPVVLDSAIRERPLIKGNSWVPRPMVLAGSQPNVVHDHSSNTTPSRRNNFGPRPRGEGGHHSNGYRGRREHNDRDWRGPRGPASKEVHVPQQIVPPPPPLSRGYFRPGLAFAAQPSIRPYGTPMGYEMTAPFYYVTTPPPESYMSLPLLPQAAPPPMDAPVLDTPLHVQILDQIEYYFSDANLVTDNFLRSNMNEEGWVPISLIAGFRRVQILTTDIPMILNSLKDSNSVEVQGDKLRRRDEWRKWLQPSENFISQSPCGPTNSLVEETSLQKLTLETISDKEVGGSVDMEVSTLDTRLSLI